MTLKFSEHSYEHNVYLSIVSDHSRDVLAAYIQLNFGISVSGCGVGQGS
jgi:hypothetical protein